MRVHEGSLSGLAGRRFAVAASRFNGIVTSKLVEGATSAFRRHGIADDDVEIVWAPGAFELPLVAQRLARSAQFDAIVCLGAVIRGATGHYEHVAGQCSAGIARVALDTGVPVVFGVLTTDTIEQALERAGTKAGNKGYESAETALEMVDLLRQLPKPT